MLVRSRKGQGLAEYALILALIAIVAILAVTALGTNISSIIQQIAGSL
jgi:pilus assembly protein Flp/PilA